MIIWVCAEDMLAVILSVTAKLAIASACWVALSASLTDCSTEDSTVDLSTFEILVCSLPMMFKIVDNETLEFPEDWESEADDIEVAAGLV
jgi:hypothetical protein